MKVLPLFAKSSYADIRTQLNFKHNKLLFDDEIGVLSSSVIDLSEQLEGLQTQVEQKHRGWYYVLMSWQKRRSLFQAYWKQLRLLFLLRTKMEK